jgi:hypothetical protein
MTQEELEEEVTWADPPFHKENDTDYDIGDLKLSVSNTNNNFKLRCEYYYCDNRS